MFVLFEICVLLFPLMKLMNVLYLGLAIFTLDETDERSLPRSSSLRDSALGDSAFGLWEGNTEPDTEYLPSSRTLMTGLTGEQERSTILHSLTENGRKKAPSLEGSDSDTGSGVHFSNRVRV